MPPKNPAAPELPSSETPEPSIRPRKNRPDGMDFPTQFWSDRLAGKMKVEILWRIFRSMQRGRSGLSRRYCATKEDCCLRMQTLWQQIFAAGFQGRWPRQPNQPLQGYRIIRDSPPHGSDFAAALGEKIADVNDRVARELWRLVYDRAHDLPAAVADPRIY
jgi:hypothetical protein